MQIVTKIYIIQIEVGYADRISHGGLYRVFIVFILFS